jgi:type IV secretory pathway TraG/TraD family ATPase VirD4
MILGLTGLAYFGSLYLPRLSQAVQQTFSYSYGEMQRAGYWQAVNATSPSTFFSLCVFWNRAECSSVFRGLLSEVFSFYHQRVWLSLPFRYQIVLYPPLVLAGLIMFFVSKRKRPLYEAKFAELHELKALRINAKSGTTIPLAKLRRCWLGLRADLKGNKDLANVLTIAPSRAGKSAHLIGVLLSWHLPAIVVDMKGELREKTAGFRSRFGKVFTLNPEKLETTHHFDPLAVWLAQDPHAAPDIVKFLLEDPQDRDTFFAAQASYPLLAAIRSATLLQKPVLTHLNDLLYLGVQGFVRTLQKHQDEEIERNLSGFLGMTSNEFLMLPNLETKGPVFSVWQTLLQRMQPFMRPELLELMSETDVTLSQLSVPSTLYIQWPEKYLDADAKPLALILHVLVTCLCDKADKRGGKLLCPTLLALDEITRYHVPALPKYISTMLGRGMSALLYAQSFSQLVKQYGETGATIIEDNCGVEMYYKPQSGSAKKLENELGQVSLKSERVSKRLKNHERTVAQGEQSRPLMTQDEIRLLKEDQTLILADSHRAILAKRLDPYTGSFLKRRLNLLAPPLESKREVKVIKAKEAKQEVSSAAFFDFDEAELNH